jgi:hypothetical protein
MLLDSLWSHMFACTKQCSCSEQTELEVAE